MKNATRIFVVGALATSGLLAFACGGGSSEGGGATTPSASAPAASSIAATSATPTATTPPAPPLTVSAMKLTTADNKHTIELKDDGTIMGDGKTLIAKFVGSSLQDADGKTLINVAADGTVTMPDQPGATKTVKFNDKDELVISDGAKMIVGDDGVVKLLNPDGKPDKDSGKVKLVGFKPTARRAATVFVLTMLMASSKDSGKVGGPAASASAVMTAKPATSAKK